MTPTYPKQRVLRAADFFAGIGLAQIGMREAGLDVVWSHDISVKKYAMHRKHFGELGPHQYIVGDLGKLGINEFPRDIDVAWASFPCTDLSVAGGRAGLHAGMASSTFWHFIKVLARMGDSRPQAVVLENVTAFGSHRSGKDLIGAIRSLNGLGYSVDVLSIDASHFVPQSRQRLFVIAVKDSVGDDAEAASTLRPRWTEHVFSNPDLITHRLRLPELPQREAGLSAYIDKEPDPGFEWWPNDRVAAYVGSLTTLQWRHHEELRVDEQLHLRTAFRRMRDGTPRWEMRADGLAGCLRTSSGGSSKQALLVLGQERIRIRWMSPREYAVLMGSPKFTLDGVINHHAYSGFGDGVCAPVVTWLMNHYIKPVLRRSAKTANLATAAHEFVLPDPPDEAMLYEAK